MRNNYLKQLLIFVLLLSANYISAQTVTTEPAFPTETEEVIITFNALEGTAGLANYTGDVYAHVGVITNLSTSNTDWKYAPEWLDNDAKYKLTRISTNEYTLSISPSIREYFGISTGETVEQIAMVFRGETGSPEGKDTGGKDIYAEVYSNELNLNILSPSQSNSIKALNSTVTIEAETNLTAYLEIFIDGNSQISLTGTSISTNYQTTVSGLHEIKIVANDANKTIEKIMHFYTEPSVVTEAVPLNLVKGINYDANDNTKASLLLYAPYKEHIFVIGDFNDWQLSPDYLMKKEGDYFWLTLSNLTPNKEYIFQYYIDGELKIADPYSEKLSDPGNDKWINHTITVYPNLIAYPDDKTEGIASVLETNRAKYTWQSSNFQRPAVNKMVIYELHLRDFTEEGTINAAFLKLDYLQDLGINVIELMPFNEFEGNSSWGYNPSFYFAPDKAYGTREDYKAFIDECHLRGIAVIQDMVLNHSYGQSPLVQMYFDAAAGDYGQPTAENPWYNEIHNFTNPAAHWGSDFNHESLQTQALVDSVNSFWITEYKVDGFRFDFTKGFGNNLKNSSDEWGGLYDVDRIRLLKRMADEIWDLDRANKPYVMFEHLSDNTEEKELADYGILLWGNMNHSYNENTMGWFGGGKSDLSWASHTTREWEFPNLVSYMESHDEERLMFKNMNYANSSIVDYDLKDFEIALKRMELAANFLIPLPGPKMIWQFGELGYDISIDDGGRVGEKPVLWHYFEWNNRKRLYQVYAALNKLKTEEIAFTSNDIALNIGDNAQKRIIIKHTDMDVVILGNFDVEEGLSDPNFTRTGTWYEYFTGESIVVSDVNASLVLAAGEYRMYTTKQLAQPIIQDARVDVELITEDNFKIYPNPASDFILIESESNITKVEILNLLGAKVLQHTNNSTLKMQVDISTIKAGIYIVNIYSKTEKTSQKIVITN